MVRTLAAQVLSKYPHLWQMDTAIRMTTAEHVFPHVPSFAMLSNDCLSGDYETMSKTRMVQCIHFLCRLGARSVTLTEFFRALFDRRSAALRLIRIPDSRRTKIKAVLHLSDDQFTEGTKNLGALVDRNLRRQKPGDKKITYANRINFLKCLDKKDLVLILRNLRRRRSLPRGWVSDSWSHQQKSRPMVQRVQTVATWWQF